MYSVQYRTKGTQNNLTTQTTHATLVEAKAGAQTFLTTYKTQYDVFISRPFVRVTTKEVPIIETPVEFDRDGAVKTA